MALLNILTGVQCAAQLHPNCEITIYGGDSLPLINLHQEGVIL